MSLIDDWADYVLSDIGTEELRNMLDETDIQMLEDAMNPISVMALSLANEGDVMRVCKSICAAGIGWARYRAEHERGEGVEKMPRKVKGL